jgi:hypothetical protein
MTDAPRMTLAQQALANFLAAFVVQLDAQERQRQAQLVAQVLPAARGACPDVFLPVLDAAEAMARLQASDGGPGDGPGSPSWWQVETAARGALILFFRHRGIAAWRAHEQSQPTGAADAVA